MWVRCAAIRWAVVLGACLGAGAALGTGQAQAQGKPAQVLVAGHAYAGPPGAQVREGRVWGPVAPLVKLWGARLLSAETATKLEFVTSTGRKLALAAGEDRLSLDGTESRLPAAPRMVGPYLYAPLGPLFSALGARVRESAELGLFRAAVPVGEFQLLRSESGLVVSLPAGAPLNGTLGPRSDSGKAYVDLRGVVLDRPQGEQYVGAGGVWRVRSPSQSDIRLARRAHAWCWTCGASRRCAG